jgi:two-component system sensor histidine kinase KdpD
VLAKATEIELIDMSPRALRQRMRHGNVYPPERVNVALDRFFTEANLTALREIALRVVARHVDDELDTASRLPSLAGATERVLVLVDESPPARRAIRRAAEIAGALQGRLVAVSVETPGSGALPFEAQRRQREALDDAADLGAEVVRVAADDTATGIAEVVRQRRVTHVVIPYQPRGRFGWLRGKTLADQLLERLGNVELHLVSVAHEPAVGSGR